MYIAGDEMFGRSARFNAQRVKMLDAITNYDVYGHSAARFDGTICNNYQYNEWKNENDLWKKKANAIGRDFIPAVAPGFNDKAVREGHEPKSRKLNTNTAEFGSLFAALLDKAKLSADRNMIIVTSWNEWYEDSQIEPTKTAPPTNIDDSITGRISLPVFITADMACFISISCGIKPLHLLFPIPTKKTVQVLAIWPALR